MNQNSYWDSISEIAESQAGIFTTAQAERLGVTRNAVSHLAKVGKVERLEHGVYRLSGTPYSEQQGIYAVWLSTNPKLMAFERHSNFDGIVVGGRSAAALQGVSDFFLSPYQFFTRERFNSRRANVLFRKREIDFEDVRYLDGGLPVTSPERTMFDLKMDHEDPEQIKQIARFLRDNPSEASVSRRHELLDASRVRGVREEQFIEQIEAEAEKEMLRTEADRSAGHGV
jgi:predicted transcriptional regulator of viral defense system